MINDGDYCLITRFAKQVQTNEPSNFEQQKNYNPCLSKLSISCYEQAGLSCAFIHRGPVKHDKDLM